MSRNVIETVMGAVVLVVAALFLFFAYSTAQVRAVRGYEVSAQFGKIDGIRDGGDVRINGIKVGTVLSTMLDPKTYFPVVRMSIDPNIKLPVDSVASISSSGLLGDKFLSLLPGGSDEFIKPGGQITQTNPSMSLEDIIGQYIFSQGGAKSGGGAGASPAPSTPGLPSLDQPSGNAAPAK
jgi:phospholipid/cholesterol/gamma-HCH transport system substrate-binding protein